MENMTKYATLEKTPCDHTVCMFCWQKIKSLKCPICRNRIYYNYDFDDRDDDGNEYNEDDATDDDDD